MPKRLIRARPIHPHAHRIKSILVLTVVLSLASSIALFSTGAISRFDNTTMQVWFLDVGQGDATLIITPEGKQILIDAGPNNTVLAKLGAILPPWDRSIDAIVVTHPDADHLTGFVKILDRYRVGEVITSGADAYSAVVDSFDEAVDREHMQVTLVKAGDRLTFDGVTLETLWPLTTLKDTYPQNRNNASVTFRVEYGQTTILLTGDAEEEAEAGFASSAHDVDVYKVGHHGSITSTTIDLLNLITPEYAVISAGFGNRHGHPHPIVLDRLEDAQTTIFRTDFQGDILLTSSGEEPLLQERPLIY
jgi:competence protein ComEC